jgi:hypothetical protein
MEATEKILEIKKLVDACFPSELKQQWTEGSIDAVLHLCERNDGLYLSDDKLAALAFFRYWPQRWQQVSSMEWGDLDRARLNRGPIAHIALFICPEDGYRVFRSIIAELNPFAITGHRWDGDDFVFCFHRNRQCDIEQLKTELKVARI